MKIFPWSILPIWCGPACFPLMHCGSCIFFQAFNTKNELHLVTLMGHLIVLVLAEILFLSTDGVISSNIRSTENRHALLSNRTQRKLSTCPGIESLSNTFIAMCAMGASLLVSGPPDLQPLFLAHWKCAQLLPRLSKALTLASLSRLPHHVDPTFGKNSWNNRLFAQRDWPDAQRLLTNGCFPSSGAPLERPREIALHFLPQCLAPRLPLTCTVSPSSLGVGPICSSERMRE